MTSRPLVSALMVTAARAERFPWIAASLECYQKQTYSPREMVIVLDDPTPADRRRLEAHLSASAGGNVRLVIPDRKSSLGALRNVSLDAALGDVICLWDDDDLHHPRRMELQVTALLGNGAGALFLADCLHLFMDDGLCYWVNWGKTRLRGLPGTLVARRNHELRYPEEGQRSQAGEDTDLLERLTRTVPTAFLPGPPFLYVYRFHGTNTWARDHHLMLARQYCEPRSRLISEQSALRQLLGDIDVGLSETNMADSDGVVYSVPGARPTPVGLLTEQPPKCSTTGSGGADAA